MDGPGGILSHWDRADLLEEEHQKIQMDFVVSIMAFARAKPKCYFSKFNFNCQCITMDFTSLHPLQYIGNCLVPALASYRQLVPFDSRKYPLTQIYAPLTPFDISH